MVPKVPKLLPFDGEQPIFDSLNIREKQMSRKKKTVMKTQLRSLATHCVFQHQMAEVVEPSTIPCS